VNTTYRPEPVPIDVPAEPAVRLIPLGGLGEIGLNMMLVECGPDILAVDCGLLFPDDEMLGVDFAIPDFSYLKERRDAFRAVVLTHGHEDHIGALSYLLRDFPVPVYGTPLTLAIARHRLAENGLLDQADLRRYSPGDRIAIGGFTVEPIRVTHSIADGIGLAIETPIGTVVHTGDFKLDPNPVDRQQPDYSRFTALGDRGVLVLCSDSTNAGRPGRTGSETEVGQALAGRFAEAPGRIIVATFASHIHRIQQVLDLAAACNRRVALLGRSMVANVAVAQELGYLTVPDELVVPLEDLAEQPAQRQDAAQRPAQRNQAGDEQQWLVDQAIAPVDSERHASEVTTQIHALIQAGDLVGVTVEHQCLAPLGEEAIADVAFTGLAPARMIHLRIHVRVETIFIRRQHRPGVARLLLQEGDKALLVLSGHQLIRPLAGLRSRVVRQQAAQREDTERGIEELLHRRSAPEGFRPNAGGAPRTPVTALPKTPGADPVVYPI